MEGQFDQQGRVYYAAISLYQYNYYSITYGKGVKAKLDVQGYHDYNEDCRTNFINIVCHNGLNLYTVCPKKNYNRTFRINNFKSLK